VQRVKGRRRRLRNSEKSIVGPDVILAEDLERLVVRRAPLVNEIVNALLAGYQFRSLPNVVRANVNFSE
jgi:hypothetical protein